MTTILEMREKAAEHARQLESVHWLDVEDLAARWGVSKSTVREISRDALPYLTFGKTLRRRYDPEDVLAYEATQKRCEDAP